MMEATYFFGGCAVSTLFWWWVARRDFERAWDEGYACGMDSGHALYKVDAAADATRRSPKGGQT